MPSLGRSFFARPTTKSAARLVGRFLCCKLRVYESWIKASTIVSVVKFSYSEESPGSSAKNWMDISFISDSSHLCDFTCPTRAKDTTIYHLSRNLSGISGDRSRIWLDFEDSLPRDNGLETIDTICRALYVDELWICANDLEVLFCAIRDYSACSFCYPNHCKYSHAFLSHNRKKYQQD